MIDSGGAAVKNRIFHQGASTALIATTPQVIMPIPPTIVAPAIPQRIVLQVSYQAFIWTCGSEGRFFKRELSILESSLVLRF